jgi:hypothetical protein
MSLRHIRRERLYWQGRKLATPEFERVARRLSEKGCPWVHLSALRWIPPSSEYRVASYTSFRIATSPALR